ncbi:hypothetical protein V3N99_21565 [Dermatophilaceae bacterium Soc4.6]
MDAPQPDDDIEQAFAAAMRDIYLKAKSEAGYNATYFLQMLSELGPLQTARRLVTSTQPSQGFTALWERGRLDLTVEARILEHRFESLFTHVERNAARERLAAYGYQPLDR